MIDRREFMKLFGVGAAVVPIIGGIPVAAAEAKLIEVPKVALAAASSLAGPADLYAIDLQEQYATTIILQNISGRKIVFTGNSFVMKIGQELNTVDLSKGVLHRRFAGVRVLDWTLEGRFVPNDKNEIGTFIELGDQ